MPTLNSVLGQQSLHGSTAKFHAFVRYTQGNSPKEIHIAQAPRKIGSPVVRVHGRRVRQNAKIGAIEEIGTWTTCAYSLEEGAVVKLYAQRIHPIRTRRRHANIYLRMRNHAPLYKLSMNLWQGERGDEWLYDSVWVQGRFDILDEEGRARFGVGVEPGLQHMCTQEALDSILLVERVESEISPLPVVREREMRVGGHTTRVRIRNNHRVLDL